MKKTVTKQDFIDALNNKENFTYQGLEKLFDCFEQLEKEKDDELEMDVAVICRDYVEFKNVIELKEEYEIPSYLSFEKIREYLNEQTHVVCFEKNCILIQRY